MADVPLPYSRDVQQVEIVIVLLVAIALLVTIARLTGLAYPVVLVIGGLVGGVVVALVPGLPTFALPPELVLALFLPPILFSAAYLTSIRDFRASLRAISLLSVGAVLATATMVAIVAHALLPTLSWPVAFALGAIVSPTDAVAATAIAQRLGVPRRIVTILEGESLINDATALVAYRVAIAVALGETVFTPSAAIVDFGVVAAGGIAVGVAIGLIVVRLTSRLSDPPVEVIVSVVGAFAAYLVAEELHVSGVLSTVAAGLILGRNAPRALSSDSRLLASGVWTMLVFLINGFVFLLIGLQLPEVLRGLTDRPPELLIGLGAAVALTVIVLRIVWVYPAAYLPVALIRALLRRPAEYPAPRNVFVVSWAGMRGAVSLAAALALPEAIPERELVIFLTFVTILATLVGQGLTLPWIIRRLKIVDDGAADSEETRARTAATEAALRRIDGLATEWPTHLELVEQLRSQYDHRTRHITETAASPSEAEQEMIEHRIIRRAVIDAEREAVIVLRDQGAISDDVLHRIERDLDFEELRMEA